MTLAGDSNRQRFLRQWALLLCTAALSGSLATAANKNAPERPKLREPSLCNSLPCPEKPPSVVAAAIGFVFQQRSAFAGNMTIWATPTQVKVLNPRRNIMVVFEAPDWSAHIFNLRTRRYFKMPLSRWHGLFGRGMDITSDAYFEDIPVTRNKVDGDNVVGLRTVRYSYTGTRQPRLQGQILRMDFLAAKDLSLPPQVGQIVTELYKLPRRRGFPLRVTYMDEVGPNVELDTSKVTLGPIPKNTFAKPSGYLTVWDEQHVLLDRNHISNMKDMVDTWGALGGMDK